mmetsp:Transcript_29892/g.49612  ORF Transcript_29892/g.49612 Transcript_29892/m.49612 type:complete len:144 (+) Transcript_29892:657-1088(+)
MVKSSRKTTSITIKPSNSQLYHPRKEISRFEQRSGQSPPVALVDTIQPGLGRSMYLSDVLARFAPHRNSQQKYLSRTSKTVAVLFRDISTKKEVDYVKVLSVTFCLLFQGELEMLEKISGLVMKSKAISEGVPSIPGGCGQLD